MADDPESMVLLDRWKAGDESAAEEIFTRYMNRLAGLARSRLSEKMQRRVDAEDVIQSVYRSFFRHAKDDRYELKRSGDLWRLLAAITVNKTMGQVEFHQAAKRAIDGERDWSEDENASVISPFAIAREPTVEEAVALNDEIEAFMKTLEPLERKVLEMRLQDRSTEKIADEVEYSPRTVRRILDRVKETLTARLNHVNSD
ncbi:RNA polymerase sigma factor [Stieleria neptunia]|nr:sigma-70 family RNA polymerase sigma factor [Stieleria neptunia]